MCRMEEAAEALVDALIQAVLAGLIFGISFGTLYPVLGNGVGHPIIFAEIWKAPLGWLFILVVALLMGSFLWMIWKARMVLEFTADVRKWRFGLRGEQAVAERLTDRSLAAAGYSSFHDVPGEGDWNIDHVVVGPGGVFVLETKARPRRRATRQQQEHVVRFDGRKLQFPWCYDDKVVEQVERNARWVREFLAAFPPKNVPVHPVIVVPGWYVETEGNYPVKAMNADYLIGYLQGMKPLFTLEQLDPVIQRLDERSRTIEF